MFQYSGDRKVDLAYPPPALTANRKQSWELETDHEPKWELELLSWLYKHLGPSRDLRISEAKHATQLMPDTQTAVSIGGNAQGLDEVVTVNIGGWRAQITQKFYFAGDIAEGFKIDTSVIADFDKNAVIEKVVQGPPDVQGKWNVCSVVMAFAPVMYSRPANVNKALAKTSIADYPSRTEVQMTRYNVSLLNFLYYDTNLYLVPLGTRYK
jgi:hypothetical protein